MRRSLVTVIAAALVLPLASCGGSSGPSTASFKQAFSEQEVQLKALDVAIANAVTGARKKSNAELASEFGALANQATVRAGALGQLNPPSNYRAELDTVQSSVTQVAGTLNSIEAAAAANDVGAAKAAAETLVTEALQIKTDATALAGKLGLPTSS
jgi:hypothetical protein